jgi:hypothetical protein
MKKFFIVLFIVALIITVFFYQRYKELPNYFPSYELEKVSHRPLPVHKNLQNNQKEAKHDFMSDLHKLSLEISRAICKQEGKELLEVTEISIKNIPIGTSVPAQQDSETILSASEAIKWLQKIANSKCSSFRKNNSETLYKFALDENNYKLFFNEYNRMLEDSRGFAPYRLIKKSLKALDEASPQDAKSLQDTILFSLNTYINDSSAFVDISGALMAIKDTREKGVISYPTIAQIDELQRELKITAEEYATNARQLIRKYFAADVDFMKITNDEIVNSYGYEGTKEYLEFSRKEYEMVQQLVRKLNALMEQNF